jgi:diguanylate cyclase (GGDEF)-like protein/PAS domain S-box-containing protein
MVEADPNDAELLARKLRNGGFSLTSTRVDRLEDARTALDSGEWDVVLSDHSLPGFRYTDVLALLQGHAPAIPLIVVSGAIGEQEVVETLVSGAASYVDKASLSHLVPTIERVLDVASLRREHLHAQQELELVRAAVNSANDLIFVLEVNHGQPTRVLFCNEASERLTGYRAKELHAHGLLALRGPDTDPVAIGRLRSAMKRGEACNAELLMYRKDGSTAWIESEVHPLVAGSNRFVSVNRDITERKKLEDQMAFLATHDSLTGLANRVLLGEQLERELALARRTGNEVAVLLIDLDGFKAVNDSRGHALGDELLREVATRLHSCVRDGDTVARLGGDEFVIVMGAVTGLETISRAAERVLATVRQPFSLAGEYWQLSVSVGISVYPTDGDTGTALMKSADLAMYHVKLHGKNASHFSDEVLQAS